MQLWREVKAQALEVAKVAEVLSGQVREWLGRTIERLAPAQELAYPGLDRGGVRDEGQDLAPDRAQDAGSDLAARLRAAREVSIRDRSHLECSQTQEPDSGKSLAERLREAAQTINPAAAAERAAGLQQERQAEERQRAHETERVREQERVREREQREHNRGWDHEL